MRHSILRSAMVLGLWTCVPLGLAPVAFETTVSQAKAATSAQAVQLALRGDYMNAGRIAAETQDPAAIKLVELLYLRDHWREAGHQRIIDFLNAAPKWPLAETLSKHVEKALYENGASAQDVLAHFEGKKPKTTFGMFALARANYQAGNGDAGSQWLNRAWVQPDIDAALEKRVMGEFKISTEMQKRRMWAMLLEQQPGAALRNAKRLSGEHQRAVKVGHELLRGVAGATRRYESLPSSMREAPALKYVLARFYRKQKKYDLARSILASMPSDAQSMISPESIWEERRIIARRSVGINNQSHWKAGYKIASQHGMTSGNDAIEAEFLSGWIALRYLKDGDRAMNHFQKLSKIATSRTDKSRALYWIGRTHAAQGNKGAARQSYKTASQYSTLYYGQLAREQVGLGNQPDKITSGEFSAEAKARVERDEVVRAFRLMQRAGANKQLHIFMPAIASRFEKIDEMNAAASMFHDEGGTTMALRFAKVAGQNGIDIDSWAYPLRGLPDWKQVGKPIEKSLVFGLSRQESEFNARAGSHVGAQGLMQLMPGTAKIVARQYRMPFAKSKLTSDPVYNVKLGAAHLADLVEDFNGSYVLTLVAYNAGPGRSVEWMRDYGDPRGGQVDPIDWVESIPFQETRQYVQKVMQNVHIYRSRLAPHTVRPMTSDLKRGTPAELTVATTEPVAVAEDTSSNEDSCNGFSISALIRSCE
jgi:soluble lytic murein transglycosylase